MELLKIIPILQKRMMDKKWLLIVAVVLGWVSPCFAYKAEVEYIPSRKYFETLQREIDGAQSSIVAHMYIFSISPSRRDSLTVKIAEALVRAKERGVRVEIVLDQNVDFAKHPSKGAWIVEGKNWAAYEYLTANGIPVYFDDALTYTHSKVIVIDRETVITGSGNWSQASFAYNVETNVLIRSSELAREILDYLATIERYNPPEENDPVVPIPLAFMLSGNLLGRMVTDHDRTGFEVYTYLLRESAVKGKNEFDLNYDKLASAMGIKGMIRTSYRRKISKVLTRLEKKYELLHFEKRYGNNARINLRDMSNPEETLESQKGKNIVVPLSYWTYGWNRRLSLSGKVFYFLGLHYSSTSPRRPRWSLSGKRLAETYHVSVWFIHEGVTELRRANLIEVMHDKLTKDVSEPRRSNIYAPNALYDPTLLEKALKELEKKHGRRKLKRARESAALVYEDSDLSAIKEFIHLEDKYGREKMKRAFVILEAKNPDNPKRSVGYFFNLVKKLK